MIAALGRSDLFEKRKAHYDGVFSYELYETDNIGSRRLALQQATSAKQAGSERIFGDRLRLYTVGAYPKMIHKDTPITVEPTWTALRQLDRDYQFVLQLRKIARR